ncbi:hypothetical protein Pfo_028679 [Paulownia fortunei]|nr:hypothetical protein Pfo_028679 [Paulownia fortunei]
MEWHFLVYSSIILLPALIFIIFESKTSKRNRLPPGPPGWPVFGHMFSLGSAPHRTIAGLEAKYGPVVWLKLGSVNTMAVLTAKAASEFFKNHDLSFADRCIVETMTAHGYHNCSLALAPHGSPWRVLRRICTVELFASKRINETGGIRRRCVEDMLSWIEKEGNANAGGNEIPVGRYVFLAAFNMLGNLMMSRDLVDLESEKGMEFYGAMKGVMEWSGRPNVSDLFPWIRWIDLQGLKRRANRDMGIAFGIASGFVKERIEDRKKGGGKERDFLDVLLEFEGYNEESGKLSETEIIIFILEMFFGGTETTSSTIEWGMTELVRYPSSMKKIQDEIDRVVGRTRKVEENDLSNLPYLQATVKEILRLYPAIPMLLPRNAMEDTEFMGYVVPKNTQIFVNAWAIHRDPAAWPDPLSFKPERFLDSDIDYKGQHFQMVPFGSGRRSCLGLTLGHRMVSLTLASLLQTFDWRLGDGVKPEALDMREMVGLTLRKRVPLKVIPTLRE